MSAPAQQEPGWGEGAAARSAAAHSSGPASAASAPAAPVAAVAVQPVRRRRLWPWVLLGLAVLLLLVAAAVAALLMALLQHLPGVWHVSVQGEDVLLQLADARARLAAALQDFWPWLGSVDGHGPLGDWSAGGFSLGLVGLVLALAVGLVLVVLSLLTLVPMLVLAVLAVVVMAVLAALLLAGALVALGLSPFWLPVLGLWWWLRRQPTALPLAGHAGTNPGTNPGTNATQT